MNKRLIEFINDKNVDEEVLKEIDCYLNKNEYTFEEMYNLSMILEIPLNKLVNYIIKPDIYHNVKDLIEGIESNDINNICKMISIGNIRNIGDKIYVDSKMLGLNRKQVLPTKMTQKLFEKVLIHGRWDLARRISSKKLHYKFNSIFNDKINKEVLLNYILGNTSSKTLSVDYYSGEIFMHLDSESKDCIIEFVLNNYRKICDFLVEDRDSGYAILHGPYKYLISTKVNIHGKREDKKYLVDDLYKKFDKVNKKKAIDIIDEIYRTSICTF